MLNEQDKDYIIRALEFFKTDVCMTHCGELIKKVEAIATLDDRTAARLAGDVPKSHPLELTTRLPKGWEVGTKLRNKRHGWEGEIVAPLGRNGLLNVDVGIGIKIGEHWSDWDFVCGPDDKIGYVRR